MPQGVPAVQVVVVPPPPPPKAWWQSKTLWANAVVLVLAAAETQLGLLQPLLPVNVYALVAFVLPLLNLVLRLVTAQAVALKVPPSPATTPPQGPAA